LEINPFPPYVYLLIKFYAGVLQKITMEINNVNLYDRFMLYFDILL